MKVLLVVLVLTTMATCFIDLAAPKLESQYVPVSKRYPGLIIGNAAAPITL